MKVLLMRSVIVGSALGALIAPPLILAAPTTSDNASSNACFGQARSYYAQGGPNGVLAPNNNGYYISQRKGTNPENNRDYIAANCSN